MTAFRVALALIGGVLGGASAVAADTAAGMAADNAVYIVRFTDPPAAVYRGTRAGLPAPRNGAGRFDVRLPTATAYRRFLRGRQSAALARAGVSARPIYRYDTALNGVAVRLTARQVAALRASPTVAQVTPDRRVEPLGAILPNLSQQTFLGLTGGPGLWNSIADGDRIRGEDVIIGVIDTGIQPENPSFYDRVSTNDRPAPAGKGRSAYGPPPAKWAGTCQTGEAFTTGHCNNKLIGARYFVAAFDASGDYGPMNYRSPRDINSHGTLVASIAAGNLNAPVHTGDFLSGGISGVAPRARIAVYKVLWNGMSGSGYGLNGDLVAAIDQAVRDGVDVINYSITGSQASYWDPVETAFRAATEAGVFVAAAGGNSGPTSVVHHPSPWVTTVAATTHGVYYRAELTLDDNQVFTGPSLARTGLTDRALRSGGAVKLAGATTADADLCLSGTLDPAKAAGAIVVCRPGTSAPADKSAEVARVGGAAAVLFGASPQSDLRDIRHRLPTIHLPLAALDPVATRAAAPLATASLSGAGLDTSLVAPQLADYSSYGPGGGQGFGAKPDLAAPGSDVFAAHVTGNASQAERDAVVAGTLTPSPRTEPALGTSMATPHVAGAAALLIQARRWTPSEIQSALITTTGPIRTADGGLNGDAAGVGAGFLRPTRATTAPVVYDVPAGDWLKWACAVEPVGGCEAVGPFNPLTLNTAALSGVFADSGVFLRKMRNVTGATQTFSGRLVAPGFTAKIRPLTLTLAPGETGAYKVTVTRTTAPLGSYAFGRMTWTATSGRVSRSPVALKALRYDPPVPNWIASDWIAGSGSFSLKFGVAGALSVAATPLVSARVLQGNIERFTGEWTLPAIVSACRSGADGTRMSNFLFGENDLILYAETRQDDVPAGTNLDIVLLDEAGNVVNSAGNDDSNDWILADPLNKHTYGICVVARSVASEGTVPYKLHVWEAGTQTAVGEPLTVAPDPMPASIGAGERMTFSAAWSVPERTRYFGAVRIRVGNTAANDYVVPVLVDTRAAAAPVPAGPAPLIAAAAR